MQDSYRKSYDIAKGLTIVLMVMGHSNLPPILQHWIYSFHMPFFFLISGFLTNWGRGTMDFVRRKTISLIIPFLIYSVANFVLFPLYGKMSLSEFVGSVLMNGWGGIALWFVPILYLGQIIIRVIPERILPIGFIISVITGYYLSFNNLLFPWCLSSLFIAIAYMIIGRYGKSYSKRLPEFIKNRKVIYFSIFGGFSVSLVVSLFYRLDVGCNNIIPIIPLMFGAICGSVFILSLSLVFRKQLSLFSYIGKETFVILAFSQCIILILNEHIKEYILLKYILLVIILSLIILFKNFSKKRLNVT